MRKILNLSIISLLLVFSFSCQNSDEFLDKKPLGEYSEVDVWKDPNLIETFVNWMYRGAVGLPFSIVRLSDLVDETHFTPDWGAQDFNKSLLTSDGTKIWGTEWASPHTFHYQWEPLYKNVRRCNIFFSKIGEAKDADQDMVKRLTGEAYFLRAYTYNALVNLYGGVPLITKVYTLTDDFTVARNTYEECINFIVGQLDSAAMYLPESYDGGDLGRATKGAALALKARVLLFAASDLHNPAKNGILTSGYSSPALLGYTGGDATARWQKAKDAAKAVITYGKYDLYKKNPAPGDSVAQNFVDLFISRATTEEDIFLQYFSPKTDEDWQGYNPALYCGPNGYHNWGNNCPLGEIVDEYEMKDGSKFSWSNAAQKAKPYAKREARFYASILYDGVPWRTRPSDGLLLDPLSRIQTGHVYNASTGNIIKPGLDTRKGPIEDWNGTYVGYYLRKFVDPTIDPQYVKQDVPFRHIRYAEVLLNYAEACIELSQYDEARTYINMIRKRAGQPELASTVTGDALRQAYRHERRVELAFEDHRFWDVRRWMIGPEAYHQTHAIDIRHITTQTSVPTYFKADGSEWGTVTYTPIETPGDARAWNNKAYFFPIYRDEMNKNDKLIQNPGY